MERKYKINFILKKDTETIDDAKMEILDMMTNCGVSEFEVHTLAEARTSRQNRALHLLFEKVAKALNERGFSAHDIISQKVEMFWTPVIIKELWKKLEKSMYGKTSTTQLRKTEEIDKIYDVFNKMLTERTHGEVSIPFPSIEELANSPDFLKEL